MKKTLAFFVLMMSISCLYVQGQDIPSKWSYGFYVQPSMNWKFRNYSQSRSTPGVGVGFELSYALSSRLNINTGLGYSQRGYKITAYSDNSYSKFSSHFMDIPLNVTYWFAQNDKFRIGANAGVIGSVLLSENVKFSNGTHYHDNQNFGDFKLSYTIGIKAEMKLNQNTSLFLQPNFSSMNPQGYGLGSAGLKIGVIKSF